MTKFVQFDAIVKPECIYIKYHSSSQFGPHKHKFANYYLFDGAYPKDTKHQEWFEISEFPEKVQVSYEPQRKPAGFKLKEPFKEDFIQGFKTFMPTMYDIQQVVDRLHPELDHSDDDEDDRLYDLCKTHIDLYYDEIKEDVPGYLEDLDFTFNKIATKETGWEFVDVPAKYQGKLNYKLVNRIELDPALLPETPCELDVKESFLLLQRFLLDHVDRNVCTVFSLSSSIRISKCIKLATSYDNTVLVNPFSSRSKKKKTVTHTTKEVKIFYAEDKETKENDFGCKFSGNSYDDMMEKANNWMTELVTWMNTPLSECPHCNGTGHLIDKNPVPKKNN